MKGLQGLDGRHKLAILGALVCWGLSVWFSYLGFKLDNDQMVWVGWVMAGVVTVVELAFNTPMHKLPLTLVAIGIICYVYGIVTNITGFWSLQHPSEPMGWFTMKALMPIIIGLIMEVLPEPLFMWGLDVKVGGDFLGNLSGLWSGTLQPQAPEQQVSKASTTTQPGYVTKSNNAPSEQRRRDLEQQYRNPKSQAPTSKVDKFGLEQVEEEKEETLLYPDFLRNRHKNE